MITVTIDDDLLEDLDTVLEYIDRAQALLEKMGYGELAEKLTAIGDEVHIEIDHLEEQLEEAE
jgi:hypothetical protein